MLWPLTPEFRNSRAFLLVNLSAVIHEYPMLTTMPLTRCQKFPVVLVFFGVPSEKAMYLVSYCFNIRKWFEWVTRPELKGYKNILRIRIIITGSWAYTKALQNGKHGAAS